jgi:hypothetical protein
MLLNFILKIQKLSLSKGCSFSLNSNRLCNYGSLAVIGFQNFAFIFDVMNMFELTANRAEDLTEEERIQFDHICSKPIEISDVQKIICDHCLQS